MIKEWESEPDEFDGEIHGYKIQIKRHPQLKHLCGYVFLKNTHSCYGKNYDDLDVSVHGGLTYSASDEEYWKIGFDCAHCDDLVPSMFELGLGLGFFERGEYRNFEFVKKELERLVDQLETYVA